MHLPTTSAHQLLLLWVQLAALLGTALLLGALARRVGQPAVAGELVAGLLLGPSVFGHLAPGAYNWWLGSGRGAAPLLAVTQVCLLGLLVVIGAETDLRLIRRLGRAAAAVSATSLVIPVAAGALVALALPATLVGPRTGRPVFALIVGAAIGVSSLPVIAKIVSDLGFVRRNVGQLAIAAGTANDAAGFFLLALAIGLSGRHQGAGGVAIAAVGVVGVTAVILTGGQRLFDLLLRQVRRHGPNVGGSIGVCVVGSLAAAAAMQAVGVEGALGAFVAGVALGRSRFQQGRAMELLATVSATVLSPLYFASAGLRVNLGALASGPALISLAAVIAVAVLAKYAGTALGARFARLPAREGAALGVALNGRGALQVIIATAGLSAGLLDTASYTLLLLMSLVTSLATAPLLRRLVAGWEGTQEEQERLGREEELDANVVVRGQRLLLPSRGRPASVTTARVLAGAWPEASGVTVLSVDDPGSTPHDVSAAVSALHPLTVEERRISSQSVLDEILAEARLGYGLIAVGVPARANAEHLLSSVVDDLLIASPVPVLIVREGRDAGPGPGRFERVLVPVSGTPSSRAGQEVALNLSRSFGSRVILAHIVDRPDDTDAGAAEPRLADAGRAADVVVRGAAGLADDMSVLAEVVVRRAPSVGKDLIRAARELGADTITIGATVRQTEGRPFLGHTVEQVLAGADATVIVVALPDAATRLGAMVAEISGQA